MITENEMRIANTSYINKDFAQIYPELLDIFKSLTSKYDPTTSNESDPGVVLLKLLGFIGDKLNYNVDKNVLECFAPSATQESSMRRILSPLGYEMGYYHGATTEVQFIYKDNKLDSDTTAKSFTFPKYGTVLTDADESVQFVLMENCTISAKNTAFKAMAIQGRVEQLTSGGSETILLESIDSNNRIYFPQGQVAENGVWVRKVDDDTEWEKVSNLNSQTPKKLVYRFGYDSSRGLPYIEFPSDLSSIIGNGLLIDYVVCDGADGNVSANTITKLSSPTSDIPIAGDDSTKISFSEESGNDLLIIKNLSASADGADPETIDEAYANFKKTVGTFDTLVTCRDYANAIYNMEDAETGSAIVSNCQVTDRRDDLMRSTRVVSFDEYGQYETNVKNGNNNGVAANDLFIYPLSPIRAYTKAGYVGSFQPLQSARYIENALENNKLASHDYTHPTGSDNLYCIKNRLGIKANISTTSKVNSYERAEIIANVTSALIKKFNAREVDYGQEIPYDSILEAIEEADERISSVSLAEPSLTTYVMRGDGDETAIISSDGLDFLLTILARNILAGRASLFDYDDDFSYEFGQKSITGKPSKLENLSKISSKTAIQLNSGEKATILKNEVVQLMAPSLVTSIQYVAYTYYNMSGLSSSVQANTNYRLKKGEKLTITYTDSSTSQEVTRVYTEGQIIKPNFDLSNTIGKKDDDGNERKSVEYTSGVVEKKVTIDGKVIPMWFVALKASETIDIEQLNSKTFNAPTYFYWIRNNSKNRLFPEGAQSDNTYETVLGDNEYLFYTDDGFSSLATLGSGTTVKCARMDASGWEAPTISYEEVYESGLLSLQDKWQYKTLSESATLTVQENRILTLVSGDDITWTADQSDASKSMTLDNGFQDINGSISYTSDGASGTWEGYGIDGVSTRIRSRLDIDAGPSLAQSIVDSRQSTKFIPIKKDESGDDDVNVVTLNAVGQEFNLSTQLQFAGSGNMDVSSLDLVTNKTKYPVSAYFHVQQKDGDSKKTVSRNADGYLTYTIKYGVSTGDGKPFSYDIPALGETKVLMLYANIEDGYQLKVSSDDNTKYLRVFNKSDDESFASSITISKSGICNLEIAPNAGSLKIEMEKVAADNSGTTASDEAASDSTSDDSASAGESSSGSTSSGDDASATILLGKLRYIKEDAETGYGYALNPDLGLSGNVPETINAATRIQLKAKLLERIRNLDNGGKLSGDTLTPLFYYTCDIDNAKVIESDDLTSPEALYDSNNVANKMTLSEIDLSTLDIDVVRSSRL